MTTIGPMIAASAHLGLGYAQRLMSDVTDDRFASFAKISGTTIESNHPAFILGHLSLYASRIIEQLGGDASSYQPTPRFVELFSKDAKCVDDPDRSIYPPMTEVSDAMFKSYRKAIVTLETADDESFLQLNPNEAMREKFATVGAMHGFYVGGHFMLHMGQLSAWQRAIGLPPA